MKHAWSEGWRMAGRDWNRGHGYSTGGNGWHVTNDFYTNGDGGTTYSDEALGNDEYISMGIGIVFSGVGGAAEEGAAAAEEALAAGGGTTKVAFGFKGEAERLADEIGGIHLMKDPNWKNSAIEIFNNPTKYEVHFSLNGIDETPMNMINSPIRSSTNWEMHQLYQSPAFESATFYHGGNIYSGFGVFQIRP